MITAIPRQTAQIVILPNVRIGHYDLSPSECDPVDLAWHRPPPPRGGRPRLVFSRDRIVTDDDLHATIDRGAK